MAHYKWLYYAFETHKYFKCYHTNNVWPESFYQSFQKSMFVFLFHILVKITTKIFFVILNLVLVSQIT